MQNEGDGHEPRPHHATTQSSHHRNTFKSRDVVVRIDVLATSNIIQPVAEKHIHRVQPRPLMRNLMLVNELSKMNVVKRT